MVGNAVGQGIKLVIGLCLDSSATCKKNSCRKYMFADPGNGGTAGDRGMDQSLCFRRTGPGGSEPEGFGTPARTAVEAV